MATRIETLGGGKRAPRAIWIMLFAIVMVAAALAIGTLVRSDGETLKPAGSADAVQPPRSSRRRTLQDS